MKKNRFTIILGVVLAAAAIYLIFTNTSSSNRKELSDFSIADTASITKFFIADRGGHSVTLERQPDKTWTVNGKYAARQEGIDLLMDVCMKIKVRTHVAKAAYNTIIKELASTGIKCEIYQNDKSKPGKVYYVGGSTQDVLGTYMMQEASSIPFIMEIPGFNGYLTPRYSALEKDWRNTTVFSYRPEEIKSISIVYTNNPEKSFLLEHSGNSFSVTSPTTKQTIQQVDTVRTINYLAEFKNLHFEGWDRDYTDQQQDSLFNATPNAVITVTGINGNRTEMKVYPKPITIKSLAQSDSEGKPLQYDVDRMYAFVNNKKELFTIQQYSFGKIFAGFSDFDRARSSKIIHKGS